MGGGSAAELFSKEAFGKWCDEMRAGQALREGLVATYAQMDARQSEVQRLKEALLI